MNTTDPANDKERPPALAVADGLAGPDWRQEVRTGYIPGQEHCIWFSEGVTERYLSPRQAAAISCGLRDALMRRDTAIQRDLGFPDQCKPTQPDTNDHPRGT